jgi:hypothetical protein
MTGPSDIGRELDSLLDCEINVGNSCRVKWIWKKNLPTWKQTLIHIIYYM